MRTPPEELERARSNCSIQRTGKLDSNRKRTCCTELPPSKGILPFQIELYKKKKKKKEKG
jgi:hypothetical protein